MLSRRLDDNHDMTFGGGLANFATRSEACAQNVRTRLMLIQEEWFLDITNGVPYLQQIAVKPADLALVESVIKQRILDTEDVAELRSFDMQFDSETRKLSIQATVSTVYGDTLNIKVVK